MDFISPQFLILFCLVIILVWVNNKFIQANTTFLIAIIIFSSILFYIWNEPKDILILVGYVIVNYFGALWLARTDQNSGFRKWILWGIILLNLGGLGYFKYSTFFATNLINIGFPQRFIPEFISFPKLLPLGISFFTFQAICYCIDVYQKRLEPGRFSEFFAYLFFFPKISSGPIMRAGDFFAQLKKPLNVNWEIIIESIYLIILGVFLKIVCADSLAVVVNKYWSTGGKEGAHALDLVIISVFFSIQIFCDFAGYTNIARGIALLMGFRMPINFIRPYTAVSFTQFWRNWHISLTEWILIYLFYPLERMSRNKIWLSLTPLLVMVTVGFWHGANWTYIVWGLIFGIGMSIERITGLNRPGINRFVRFTWAIITQVSVLLGWIFFRSNTVNEGLNFIGNIYHGIVTPGLFLPTPELISSAFPLIDYWRLYTDGSFYDLIFPALIDILPILTIIVVHVSAAWDKSDSKDEKTVVVGLGKAILAGILLFFCISAYANAPAPYLYFQF